jgi:hypothetical protein
LRLLAGCAAQDVSAQRRAAALFDGRHHLQLSERQVSALLASEGRPGGAEDIRNLELGAHEAPRYGVRVLSIGLTTARSTSVATCV